MFQCLTDVHSILSGIRHNATAQLIFAFVFAYYYAKIQVCHDGVYLSKTSQIIFDLHPGFSHMEDEQEVSLKKIIGVL